MGAPRRVRSHLEQDPARSGLLAAIQEASGRSLGSISMEFPGSGILEACLGGLWGISGGLLEVSERSLGGLWEVSGKSLGGLLGRRASRRLQKVLDSKSDAI